MDTKAIVDALRNDYSGLTQFCRNEGGGPHDANIALWLNDRGMDVSAADVEKALHSAYAQKWLYINATRTTVYCDGVRLVPYSI